MNKKAQSNAHHRVRTTEKFRRYRQKKREQNDIVIDIVEIHVNFECH